MVAAYESQFRARKISGFEVDDLQAEGGASGRATADYTVTYEDGKPTKGKMTWVVLTDKGRPRIALIAFRPQT